MKKNIIGITSILGLAALLSFNTTQKGSGLKKEQNVQQKLNEVKMKRVTFKSEGLNLVGNLFYPPNYEEGKTSNFFKILFNIWYFAF